MYNRHSPILAIFICFLATSCVYWVGLNGDFMFDDKPNILGDASLRLFDGSITSLLEASSDGHAGPLGRPLSLASLALNFYFFGSGPFSFKLVNLIIHLFNGLLVFILARQLLPRLSNIKQADTICIASSWIAAVWLLHPINLTPVLLVIQRMTSLAAFFTLAALCLYCYGRTTTGVKSKIAFGVGLLCWPAAIFCKETGALIPLFICLCEWLAFESLRKNWRKIHWNTILAFAVLIGISGSFLLIENRGYLIAVYAGRDFNLAERLMTEARVLWFYFFQLITPWSGFFGLFHDDIPISHGLFSPPQTALAIIGGAFILVASILRRKQSPLLAFAILWFLAAHVLESTILPLEITFEHRNYLASLGLWMYIATVLFSPGLSTLHKIPALVFAACFLAFCALTTTLRASQWSNEYNETQFEVHAHPNSPRANYEAARMILEKENVKFTENEAEYKMARGYFQRATELDLSGKDALLGIMYADCLHNGSKDLSVQLKLRERFAHAHVAQRDATIVQSLSDILVEKRLCLTDEEVKSLLDAALSNPWADGRMRGLIYAVAMDYSIAKIGSLPSALNYAQAATDSDPGSIPFRINLIHLLLASGEKQKALQKYASLLSMTITLRDKPAFEELKRKITAL